MSFALDLAAFAEKAKDRADTVVGATVAYIVEQIDERSPVGNPSRWKHPERAPEGYVGGRFRGNWQLGIGVLPVSVLDRIDPSGSTTVTAALSAIPEDAAGKVYYYANSLPYARALEYGHSSLAPSPGGIVGLTLIDARSYVERIAADLNK